MRPLRITMAAGILAGVMLVPTAGAESKFPFVPTPSAVLHQITIPAPKYHQPVVAGPIYDTLGRFEPPPLPLRVQPVPSPKTCISPCFVDVSHPDVQPTTATGPWRTTTATSYGIGDGFLGRGMACGGPLTRTALVVAQGGLLANGPRLPCGTKIEIIFSRRHAPFKQDNCTWSKGIATCTVVAVVRDRGPYIYGRGLDLGPAVAKAVHFSGLGLVRYRVVKP